MLGYKEIQVSSAWLHLTVRKNLRIVTQGIII